MRAKEDDEAEEDTVAIMADQRVVHDKTSEPGLDTSVYPVGTKVRKFFEGHGWFTGQVSSVDEEFYKVTYEDGDSEEYTERGLTSIVLTADMAKVKVGSRVAVYWPAENEYFSGTITDERNKKLPHRIEYEDGGSEWIDLMKHNFRLLTERSPRNRNKSSDRPPQKGSKRRRLGETDDFQGCSGERACGEKPKRWVRPRVKKFFDDCGWCSGQITGCEEGRFHVAYENGVAQVYNEGEISKVMITPKLEKVEVGSRVAVRRDSDGKFYEATVIRAWDEKIPFVLEYEQDGSSERVDLRECKFQVLPGHTRCREEVIEDDPTSDSEEDALSSNENGEWKESRDDESIQEAPSHRTGSDASACRSQNHRNTDDIDADAKTKPTSGNGSSRPQKGALKNQNRAAARPRGRPPIGKTWDAPIGMYVNTTSNNNHEWTSDTLEAKIGVGSRLAVLWPTNRKYYDAMVTHVGSGKDSLRVQYDDNSWEWINPRRRKYRLLTAQEIHQVSVEVEGEIGNEKDGSSNECKRYARRCDGELMEDEADDEVERDAPKDKNETRAAGHRGCPSVRPVARNTHHRIDDTTLHKKSSDVPYFSDRAFTSEEELR